jgi:hypothetical protein
VVTSIVVVTLNLPVHLSSARGKMQECTLALHLHRRSAFLSPGVDAGFFEVPGDNATDYNSD